MGTVTYPNADVQRDVVEHFVPVQFNVVEQPEVMERFNSAWTPSIIVQDVEGREYRRSLGYLDPRRFLGEMALARLMWAVHRQRWPDAANRAAEAAEIARGDQHREPEVLYFAAVADYKVSKDANKLLAGWNRLLDQFPQSEWAKRAEFIRRK